MTKTKGTRLRASVIAIALGLPLVGCGGEDGTGWGGGPEPTPEPDLEVELETRIIGVHEDGVDIEVRWIGADPNLDYSAQLVGEGDWTGSGTGTDGVVRLERVPFDSTLDFCLETAAGQTCLPIESPRQEAAEPPTDAVPERPGQPQIDVIESSENGARVAVQWEAPAGGAWSYRLDGGANQGATWRLDETVRSNKTELRNVPNGGNFWICVRGLNAAGEEGAQACNSFTTPMFGGGDGGGGVAVNECANPRPEWIWCDDFEEDRRSSYFESSMPLRRGVGLDGSTGAVGRYVLGSSEAGNFKVAFGRVPSASFRPVDGGTRHYREIYWRVFVKTPENWQGQGADKLSRAMVMAGSNWQQAMIAHVWSGSDPGPNGAYLMLDPARGTNAAGSLVTTRYNDFNNLTWMGAVRGRTPLFEASRRGEWQCVEARVRLNDAGQSNGVFELWVNDEPDARITNLNWVGRYNAYGINAIFLENYWNNRSPVEQERYMDNFVISTERIGCDIN